MNRKKTIIISLFLVWGFIFVIYTLSDPNNLKIHPAQEDLTFHQASNLVTGYFNSTSGIMHSTMPKIP